MKVSVKCLFQVMIFALVFLSQTGFASEKSDSAGEIKLSGPTQACISCHRNVTPGIVKDWLTSRHAKTAPEDAIKKPELERRVSAKKFPENLREYAVGCYECHSQNRDKHKDNFRHMGYSINVIVSPEDCKVCHPTEVNEYVKSKKGNAWKNIMKNPLYHTLVSTINGVKDIEGAKIVARQPSDTNLADTCLGCHGTKVEVKGMKKVSFGDEDFTIDVPELTNWPSQGVGRENPDGSIGACTSCHPRHSFSIEIARKPYTCAQCHLDPDVPAWNVYKASKHGNIFSSKKHEWNFSNVPWILGKDFTAPTCATCHVSLVADADGNVIAQRSHDFGSRLWVRLFGLIYSVPQPKSGDTTIIRNKDGLPMPSAFTGEPASEYLIDKQEQEARFKKMKAVCLGCHSTSWTDGHFAKLKNTIKETNEMTASATRLMVQAWDKKIEDNANPFDEAIEKLWIKQWLFYSNSIRYASAMTGAHDYAAFKNGWWELSDNLQKMRDMILLKSQIKRSLLKKQRSPRKR